MKYGVISTASLQKDLQSWETLYISGRLQKPHLPLFPSINLTSALETNKKTAFSLALILLGERFTEYQLWEKIAGISYAGDPRMSIPGAENPEKVRNIVRGQGALEGFRAMYGDLLEDLQWEGGQKDSKSAWRGSGDEHLVVCPLLCAGIRLTISNPVLLSILPNSSCVSHLGSCILLQRIIDLQSSDLLSMQVSRRIG